MAEVKRLTGAKVYVTEGDAAIAEDGGKSDPAHFTNGLFAPVKVDRRLKDGDVVALGGTELKVISTPGHSRGSVSYWMTVEDAGKKRTVAIANMLTAVIPLVGNAEYPGITEDFSRSFEKQKALSPEIWVAGHASQYGMQAKHRAGSFVDPQGYKDAVLRYEKAFREQLAKERGGRK
jgi:metallo-beta-lactamase class B